MNRSSVTSFYQADGLGSVTSLTDGSGQVAASYTYDSFGNVTNSTGSLVNPFRYTGREWDSETSLYNYRARYYDQSTGRFLSEDPLGFLIDANFYAYTHNRPTTYVDPLGLQDFQEGLNDLLKVGLPNTRAASNFADEASAGAEAWARQRGLPGTSIHNGAPDAWRHCFWSCTMTKYLGAYVAEIVANEHEEDNNRERPPQPVDEEIMDRTNNRLGRSAALSNCAKNGKSCWDLCTDLYNHHRLVGLRGRPNYFPNDMEK